MTSFTTSSQKARWIWKKDALLERRTLLFNQRLEEVANSLGIPRNVASTLVLTIEEEEAFKQYYAHKIPLICVNINVPDKVSLTGLTYFKRFYMKQTVQKYHPKDILPTCIFLACKTEESNIPVEQIAKPLNSQIETIIQTEVVVLDTIDFDLMIYHPSRTLR
eukprot:TRINITY_DN6319_c0_g1_i1.p1 TRINITY_DN6319_c0_g1~~TRINITY_DN6319_c0_g1_i1.p1  ORF type:complete len:171 (+),score=30.36 TRINITY_DN6319_c0_g1_i1:25-513(+)